MTDTPDPTIRHRPSEQVREIISTLCDAIWNGKVPPGKHLWSIPVNMDRDFDMVLVDLLAERDALFASDAQTRLRLASQASQIDRLDCTVREGGDTRHCPVNQQCQRCRLDALEAEKGKAYWRGFQQATYNRPGALSTANHIVAIEKELAEVKAQLTLAESSRASLEAENKELKVTTAWLLVETDKRGKQPKERIEGIALTHEAKDNFMRGWYEQGFSRTALPYKIHPKPLPPSFPSPQEPT